EDELGVAVPLGDEAIGAHGDEGVVGVVEDEAPALLAGPQHGLSLLDVGNIRAGAEPFDNATLAVADGRAAGLEPAVHAVPAADAVFYVVGATTRHRVGPESPGRLPVVRVQHFQPAPAQQVTLGYPGVFRPLGA